MSITEPTWKRLAEVVPGRCSNAQVQGCLLRRTWLPRSPAKRLFKSWDIWRRDFNISSGAGYVYEGQSKLTIN